MPQHVTVDGVGVVEFPDGMSAADIQSAIASNFGGDQPAPATPTPVPETAPASDERSFRGWMPPVDTAAPDDEPAPPPKSQAQKNFEFQTANKQRLQQSGQWDKLSPVAKMMYEPVPPDEGDLEKLGTFAKNIPEMVYEGSSFIASGAKKALGLESRSLPQIFEDITHKPAGSGDTALIYEVPSAEHKSDDSVPVTVAKEVYNLLAGVVNFAQSPKGLLATAGGGLGKLAARVIAGGFALDTAHSLGSQVLDSYQNWGRMTANQKAKAVVDMLGSGFFTGLLAKGAISGHVPGTKAGEPESETTTKTKGTTNESDQAIIQQPQQQPNEGTQGNAETGEAEIGTAGTLPSEQGFAADEQTAGAAQSGIAQPEGEDKATTELVPQWRQKMRENLLGRAINVSPSEMDEPSAHLQNVLGKDAPTWRQLINAGIVEPTAVGVPARAGDIGLKFKELSPNDLQPALFINDKPITGGATHQEIALNLAKQADDPSAVLSEFDKPETHVFVDQQGNVYDRQQAAAALGEKEPLQSARLNELKAAQQAPSPREKVLADFDAGKIKPAVGEPANVIANWALMDHLELPSGWKVKDTIPSQYGSGYWQIEDPEGNTYKVSVRDHQASPFREQEFGATDIASFVKDASDPHRFSGGMKILESKIKSFADSGEWTEEARQRRIEADKKVASPEKSIADKLEDARKSLAIAEDRLKRGYRVGVNKPITTENQRWKTIEAIERQKQYIARLEKELTPSPAEPPLTASPVVQPASGQKLTTIYRAGDADEKGVKAFSSWSRNKDTAAAYLDNPGFGGKSLREEQYPLANVLEADTTNRSGMADLAEKLGFSRETGDQWFDNGWRYPWEESANVRSALSGSGYDAIQYIDDFPKGSKTIVPLKDFTSESVPTIPPRSEAVPSVAPTEADAPASERPTSRDVIRFENETKRVGPDILEWMRANMRVMGRGAAKARGEDYWRRNSGDYDGALDLIIPPHQAKMIFGRFAPDQVAQAAFDAKRNGEWSGSMEDATPQSLWDAIKRASAVRMQSKAFESGEIEKEETGAIQQEKWSDATRSRTDKKRVPVYANQLSVGDVLEVEGQRLIVRDVDAEGVVTLDDGKKFGSIRTDSDVRKPFWVEKYEPKGGEAEFLPPGSEEPEKPVEAISNDEDLGAKAIADRVLFAFTDEIPPPKGDTSNRIAAKLKDGRIVWFPRGASSHVDMLGLLPKEILDQVADGGFLIKGQWESGGDLSRGIKPGQTVRDYYSTNAAEVAAPTQSPAPAEISPDQQAALDAAEASRKEAEAKLAKPGTAVNGFIKHTDGRWYKAEEDGTLSLKENGKPKRIAANRAQVAKLEAAAALPPAPEETRSPMEILNQAKRVSLKVPSGATAVRLITAGGKKAQLWVKDFNGENLAQGADAVKIEAGIVGKDGRFQPMDGDVGITEVKRPPAANLGAGLPEGAGSSELEVRDAIKGVDTAGMPVNVITKAEAEAITGMPEARGYGGFYYEGKIYLVRENIGRGKPEAVRALLREEVGHGILRTAEGQRIVNDALAKGKLQLTEAERQVLLKKGYTEENLLDEFIAKSAMENRPWWKQAVERVRVWLSKAGLADLSNAEVARMLLRQIKSESRGSKISGAFKFGIASGEPVSDAQANGNKGSVSMLDETIDLVDSDLSKLKKLFGDNLDHTRGARGLIAYTSQLHETLLQARDAISSGDQEVLDRIVDYVKFEKKAIARGMKERPVFYKYGEGLIERRRLDGMSDALETVGLALKKGESFLPGLAAGEAIEEEPGDAEEGLKRALTITKNSTEAQLGREAPIRQNNLSALTGGKSVYHETNLQSAYGVYQGLRRPFKQSWTQFFVSDNPDLALGQSGNGVLFEIDPDRVNGWRYDKPGTSERTGYEYSIDRSIQKSVRSITFSNERQMETFKKRFPNSLDYSAAENTERGLKVPSKDALPRLSPGEPIEEDPPEEAATQVAGEQIGVFRQKEKIAPIRDGLRTAYFDGTQPVSEDRTSNAWELARRFTNPDTKRSFADEVARSGNAAMAPGLLRNELWEYAVKLALAKKPQLLEFMTLRSQDFQTISGEMMTAFAGGDTQAGRILRAAAERAAQGLWQRMVTYTKAQLETLGAKLSVGLDGAREIIEAIGEIAGKIDSVDLEEAIRTGTDKQGRTIQQILEINSEERKAAEEVTNATGLPPARKATILETVYEWMKNPVTEADQDTFVASLKQALMKLRLNDEQSQTIADATWVRKTTVDGANRRRLWDAELRRLDELAEKTAQGYISKVDQAEWKRPEQPNEVKDIITEALKSKDPLDSQNIMGYRTALRERLMEAGLSEKTARALADAISKRRETDLLNAGLRARQRAADSKNVRSLVEAIQASPYLAQSDPKWRMDTARDWFMSNGLSRESAIEAAKVFDAQFVKAMESAIEREVNRLTQNGKIKNPRTVPELIAAVRLGLTDPNKNWVDILANRSGFKSLTAEQHARLAQLEQKYSRPDITPHEEVDLVEQMNGVMRHVGDGKGHFLRAMGESFAMSLLAGFRTMGLHAFQPLVTNTLSLFAHGLSQPRDFPALIKGFLEGAKAYYAEVPFAWQKDAYAHAHHQIGLWHNELKRQFEISQQEFKDGKYVKAVPRMFYAWQQYVGRALQTLNQAAQGATQRWKMALYGSIAMREARLSTREISDMVDYMRNTREAEYAAAIAKGYDKTTARVIAIDYSNQRMQDLFRGKLGNFDNANKVNEAAVYDAASGVGWKAPGIGEMDEGMMSRPINFFMSKAKEARAEGGLPSILAIMAVGFMNVPFRMMRYLAGWSPYGLARWIINRTLLDHKNEPWVQRFTNNKGTFWQQSYKNDIMAKARLREALIGTAATFGFLGWQIYHHTSDDDAEKKAFAMYVTGKGPVNKTLNDAWRKRGFDPMSINVVVNGKVVARMPIQRVGEAFASALGLAASADDVAWKRKEEAVTGRSKNFMGRDLIAALGTYYDIVGAQGVLQAGSHLSQLGRGESGVGKAVATQAVGTASAIVIPGKAALQSVSDLLLGAPDRTSATASIMAQIPVVNTLVNGKAVNRFGDEIGDRTWAGKLSRLGLPTFRVDDTPENRELYQMLFEKGAAPPDLRRYIVEEQYGPLTQDEWNKFVKTSGDTLKASVVSNMEGLQSMPPEAVRQFMLSAATAANAQAAQSVGLQPIKATGRGSQGGGQEASGGGGPSDSAGLPKAPSAASAGVSRSGSGGSGSAGGRGVSIPRSSGGGAIGAPSLGLSPSRRGAIGGTRTRGIAKASGRPKRFVSGRLKASSGSRRISLPGSHKKRRVGVGV